MKIRVNPHTVEIIKEQTEPINEREIKVSKCEFEFDEVITSDFVKEAYFTLNGNTYKQIIVNNECNYPSEVLTEKGTLEIGVVAFKVENDEEIVRYNPSPDYFESWVGSLKDAENSEPITPSEMEQFEQALQEGLNEVDEALENVEDALEEVSHVDIDAEQLEHGASVTITNRNNEPKTVVINDGEQGETGQQGDPGRDATINGVNTLNIIEGTNISLEQTGNNLRISNTYSYDDTEVRTDISNLKTNKADKSEIPTKVSQLQNDSGFITNAVNNLINYYLKSETYSKSEVNDLISAITTLDLRVVETLPTEDISTTTIYLVTKSSAGTNDAYDEYIYVSNNWEFIGSTQVDLTDYVKNTDYGTSDKGGTIKVYTNYGLSLDDGKLRGITRSYNDYLTSNSLMLISKITLENVITGKDLTTKAYVDDLVGDIESILTTLDVGGGV